MTDPTEFDPPPLSAPRGLGQRVAFGAALLFYACAILSFAAIFIWVGDLGGNHPIIGSLAASVVFFVGGGLVLHVIGQANLPYLRFRAGDPGPLSIVQGDPPVKGRGTVPGQPPDRRSGP